MSYIRCLLLAAALFVCVDAARAQYMQTVWQTIDLGENLGISNIHLVDLDGDGRDEILMGGGGWPNRQFFVLAGYADDYELTWVSGRYDIDAINQIAAGAGPGFARLYVTLLSGRLEVFDGATMSLLDVLETGQSGLSKMQVDDVDDDGELEVLVGAEHFFQIYDAQTLDLEWESVLYTGMEFKVGQVDEDPQHEIVFANGLVLDGISRTADWQYAGGFGQEIELADVDADGTFEILASNANRVAAFDAELKTPLWEFEAAESIDEFRVVDLPQNEGLELIVGETWGVVRCFALESGQRLWSIESNGYGINDFAFGDPDGDGTNELVWAGENIFVVDTGRRQIEWMGHKLDGPFFVRAADLDGDRREEIIGASAGLANGSGGGELFALDGRNHAPLWSIHPGKAHERLEALAAADVDGDGVPDLITANGSSLSATNGRTGEKLWSVDLPNYATALDAADIDLDGNIEAVVGCDNGYVAVIDAATLIEEWTSINTGSRIGAVVLKNIDDDENHEILFFNVTGHIHAYDGTSHLLEWQSVDADSVTALEVGDIDIDGRNEIIAGHLDGGLTIFDGDDLSLSTFTKVHDRMISALALANLDQTVEPELIIGSESLIVLRTPDFETLWERPRMATYDSRYTVPQLVGWGRSVAAADVDEDGFMDVLVGGPHGLFHFEATERYPDTTPPAISVHSPIASAASVAVDAAIQVVFSEPLDADSFSDGRVTVLDSNDDNIPILLTWRDADSTLILAPDFALPPSTSISVRLSAEIRDLAGNMLDGNGNGLAEGSPTDDYAWTFSSGAGIDTVGPSVFALGYDSNVWAGAPFSVSVVVADTSSLASGWIVNAEAYLDDEASPVSILAVDGVFDEPIDTARVTISTSGLGVGEHVLFVRAQDARGNWGARRSIPFRVQSEAIDNWVMYGFDAQHTGANTADSIKVPLTNAWQSPETVTVRGVITVGDVVIMTSQRASDYEGLITVHDIETGQLQWDRALGPVDVGMPAYGYGRVYIQTYDRNYNGFVSAFELGSGDEVWQTSVPLQSLMGAGPTVHQGRVFTSGGMSGGVYAHDAFTGEELWVNELPRYDFWTPAAAGDSVYTFVEGTLSAFTADGGWTAWTLHIGDDYTRWGFTATPVVDREGSRMFLASQYHLHAVDMEEQSVLWEKEGFHPHAGAYYDGIYYVLEDYRLVAYNAATGAQEWEFAGDGYLTGGPVLAGDYIFVSGPSKTFAIDRLSREVKWTTAVGADWQASLTAGSGRLVILEYSIAHVFEPSQSHVSAEDPALPIEFALLPNYPNPFNPSTQITYRVAAPTHVLVEVYNAIGQRVATLVDGHYSVGEYKVTWDAAGYSSGMYVYRMRADAHTETRQMVLLR